MPNFKPMFEFYDGERAGNSQVFATFAEAYSAAGSRHFEGDVTTGFGVDKTDAPVNYYWTEAGAVSLSSEGG